MNTWSSINFKFFVGRLLVLFTALLMVAGLVFTLTPDQALGMRREDPGETDPIGVGNDPPPYTAPAGGFTWSMEKRFGLDQDGDGMIDYHWNRVSMTYDPAYIYPTSWKITFNGCRTGNDNSNGTLPAQYDYEYAWTLDNVVLPTLSCKPTRTFTDKSTHTMGLMVTKVSDGTTQTFPVQTVQVKDYFIVSLGDSYASGQGNPDIEQEVISGPFGIGWVQQSPAQWQDERCHRSANAAPALAALALEASDPHSSVTFISFACTGSTIQTPQYDLVFELDHNPYWGLRGSGILGPQRGEITDVPWGDVDNYIPPQMTQLATALAASNGQSPRQIDALLISAGGNDMKFAPIMKQCILFTNCWVNWAAQMQENPTTDYEWYTLTDIVTRAVGLWTGSNPPAFTVPGNYAALGAAIDTLSPKPAHVYVTQYPDPTINDRGVSNQANETYEHHCRMLDDVLWPNPLNVMTDLEAQYASHFAQTKLNEAVRNSVANLASTYTEIDWQFVDGLSVFDVDPNPAVAGRPGLFMGGPDGGPGHGYCADDNWIRRADESELIQGPVNWRAGSVGTMHPNYSGQQAVKSRILRYMLPDLTAQSSAEPPSFSFSYSSGGLTSQPGLNGWYIQSCDSNNACQPKVVGQAVATSTINLNGASISVNDTGGCSVAGVSCSASLSTDQKQVTYTIEINATGTYRFQFNAQDANGQQAFLQKEIKVDLENPVLAPFGPFEVAEGGSVVVSASVATDADGVPLNGDVLVDFDWDLDHNGTFPTTDEQPEFSAAGYDGPTTQDIRVLVTDRAGRRTIGYADVNITNVAPSVSFSGAPATSPEGTAISLTSSVTDPGVLDTFTYAWSVKKDGTSYATGSTANFSFTPDDDGSYEVSLTVTDDDGGVGTATSQTITVTNAAPVLSNVTVTPDPVNEGGSVTLSGAISDASSVDAFHMDIDWGDGSTLEPVSVASGSTSFSQTHTYADDNPTGTASDSYAIGLTIYDDDGGTGTGSTSVVVDNLAPSVTISAPESGTLYPLNTMVNLSAALADPNLLDTLTCSVNWGEGVSVSGTLVAGVCTASHAYTVAGVYTIQVTGTDDDTGSKTETVMVVVYDPSAGFVTGGGWIDSPTGAYKADTNLTGKATFGFVSKYKKGANVPTGNTAFEFDLAGLAFASQSYDWLVVNQGGTNAQFKGSGLINGLADPNGNAYKFMLWAGDGSPDTFRIKIWWDDAAGEHTVYDNGVDQAIGGGSIVIHSNGN